MVSFISTSCAPPSEIVMGETRVRRAFSRISVFEGEWGRKSVSVPPEKAHIRAVPNRDRLDVRPKEPACSASLRFLFQPQGRRKEQRKSAYPSVAPQGLAGFYGVAFYLASVVVELVARQVKVVVPAYAVAARVDAHLLEQTLYVRQGLKGSPFGEQRLDVVDLAGAVLELDQQGEVRNWRYRPDCRLTT